jgi:sugar phosphate isomerase/epimerase
MTTILAGFADEAAPDLDVQIRATKELGWKHIEMRNVQVPGHPAANLHDISDEAFEQVVQKLGEADIQVYCFGSAIANGAKSILEPFDVCWDQAVRAAARMPKLGSKFIRIMSYPVLKDGQDQLEGERFRRLRALQRLFDDAGVTVVHENCSNYGGMGWTYSHKLLENVPGLKLVFDMGNCVAALDYSRPAPHPRQSAWDFYKHVREHIAHMHIKDGMVTPEGKHVHVFPGEGEGDVAKIITDLRATDYTGAFSIEPHIGVAPMFQDAATKEEGRYLTYVEYGKRLTKLMAA